MTRIFLAALLAAVAPALVFAHGPSRKKEVNTIEINAPADKVWAIVSKYDDMTWHPAIAKSEVTGGMEVDVAKRTLTFKSGAVITDKLTKFETGERAIAFLTDAEDHKALPIEGYSSTITVTDAAGKSNVEWKGAFYRGYLNNDPPPGLTDKDAVAAIKAFQTQGLEALKAKAEATN